MTWLRQSTAGTVVMGPFVGTADGYTAGTAYTISQADIRLSKNGAAFAQSNNSAGAAHMENGYYAIPFDTTDTNTLGRLRCTIVEAAALPVWRDFEVVPSQVWDSFFASDKLQVHVDEMTAGIITATVIATDAIDADALADGAITSGVFAAGAITAAAIATDAIDADALATDAIAEINATVDTAISDAALATAANLATLTGYVDTEVAAIKAKTDNLPSDPADASDISTATTTIAGYIDTEVASILAAVDTEIATLVTNVAAILAGTGTDGVVISEATAQAIADEVLKRSVTNVQDTASTTSLTELILAMFESARSGTTWTVRKTGGTTFNSRTLTLDDTADPVTGVT